MDGGGLGGAPDAAVGADAGVGNELAVAASVRGAVDEDDPISVDPEEDAGAGEWITRIPELIRTGFSVAEHGSCGSVAGLGEK